jgi:hypothetical protein
MSDFGLALDGNFGSLLDIGRVQIIHPERTAAAAR